MGDSRIEAHRHVDAPAEVLYALISDLPRMAEWSPENCSGRWLTDTGPVVGARLKGSNRRKSLRWSTVATVTVAEPARHFEFVISIGPAKRLVTWGYRLEPDGSGTLVTEYHIDHRPGWVVAADRSISRLESCDAHHQASMETTLANLAAAAENRTSG